MSSATNNKLNVNDYLQLNAQNESLRSKIQDLQTNLESCEAELGQIDEHYDEYATEAAIGNIISPLKVIYESIHLSASSNLHWQSGKSLGKLSILETPIESVSITGSSASGYKLRIQLPKSEDIMDGDDVILSTDVIETPVNMILEDSSHGQIGDLTRYNIFNIERGVSITQICNLNNKPAYVRVSGNDYFVGDVKTPSVYLTLSMDGGQSGQNHVLAIELYNSKLELEIMPSKSSNI